MILLTITNQTVAQDWETVFSVDSRIGYSTNSYLNPYYAEWDRTNNIGFGVLSGIGQTTWLGDDNLFEFTGVAVIEPLLGRTNTWKGGLGLVDFEHHFSSSISAGIEMGGSYFNASYSRGMVWAQPKLVWSPTPFTQFKIKAGSNFRSYQNYSVDSVATSSNDRSDLYAFEFDTWPNFNWKFSSGLYGGLDNLPSVQEGFSSFVALSRLFTGGSKVRVKLGLEQYQNEQTVTSGGSGGGFPPVGGQPPTSTETIKQTNRIIRLGIEGSVPISNNISAFANIEGLHYKSTVDNQNLNDVQVSGGIRLSLQPKSKKERESASPNWNINEDVQSVEVTYSGEGRLYLVGDFNNWKRPGLPLISVGKNEFSTELTLDPGSYEYKILIVKGSEKEWMKFSGDTYTVDDGFAGENALLLVQ